VKNFTDILKSVRQIVESQVSTKDKTIGKLSQPGSCDETFSLWLSFVYSIFSLRCDGGWVNVTFTTGNKKVAVRQGYTGPWFAPIISFRENYLSKDQQYIANQLFFSIWNYLSRYQEEMKDSTR